MRIEIRKRADKGYNVRDVYEVRVADASSGVGCSRAIAPHASTEHDALMSAFAG
jgi:hypothetical protein